MTDSIDEWRGAAGYAPPMEGAYALPGRYAPTHAPARQLAVVPVAGAAEWARLLSWAPSPHLQQGFAYGEGKRAKGWRVERVGIADGDRIVALCQVLEMRVLGVRALSRISRGPVFLADSPAAGEIDGVYRTIRRRWASPLAPLLIAPALEATRENRELLREAGFRERTERGWQSMRIDLGRPPVAIRASLASTFRNRLQAAERSGLGVRVAGDDATIDWMIERHLENQRQKRFRGATGGFLRELRAASPEDYLVFQALLEGRPVAGMSVVRYGQVGEYHTGWFGPPGRKANAGNFLMWAIICELKARGYTQFDVGGLYDGHGYTQFKRGLRGAEFALAGEWIAF